MKIRILWIILAILCAVYGILVMNTGSGTGFFIVWFILSAFFIVLAWFSWQGLWKKLPAPVKLCFIAAAAALLCLFIIVEALIIGGFKDTADKRADVIIVLGAQVYESGPSTVLRYRLDKAYEYLENSPETICIVSGGQGSNEPFPEAYGMKDYLVSKGIEETRIITEDRSDSTRENIDFSMELYDMSDCCVGIVTNNFHMYRALKIAEKAGLSDVCAIPSGSTPLYLPNNMLREFFGVLAS